MRVCLMPANHKSVVFQETVPDGNRCLDRGPATKPMDRGSVRNLVAGACSR